MTQGKWKSEVRLTSDVNEEPAPEPREVEDKPFVIAVLADLCGPAGKDRKPRIAERRFVELDRDNFDEVMARQRVQWQGRLEEVPGSPGTALPVRLEFRALEDFEPDRIVRQIEPLSCLVDGLRNPSRLEDFASDLLARAGEPAVTAEESRKPAYTPPRVDGATLLESIVSGTPVPSTSPDEMEDFVRDIVRPHALRSEDSRESALKSAAAQALAVQLRAILHDRAFQTLESTWRSLHWLVTMVETGPAMKIELAHVTKAEILEDLDTGAEMQNSGLAKLIRSRGGENGGEPLSLLIGDYEFSTDLEDLAVLERLANIAQRLRAPLVAAAGPRLVGCESFAELSSAGNLDALFKTAPYEAWRMMRRSSAARWAALALPRLLCRLPFGRETNPTETFPFEEEVGGRMENLVWGNPAFAVAAVIAEAFCREGWNFDLSEMVPRLDGFPLYVYEDEGEKKTVPCAEALLSEKTLESLESAGLCPLLSRRDSDCVLLTALQTTAEPRAPIRW